MHKRARQNNLARITRLRKDNLMLIRVQHLMDGEWDHTGVRGSVLLRRSTLHTLGWVQLRLVRPSLPATRSLCRSNSNSSSVDGAPAFTMLSVSPPLHKDFRARHQLCSPGDGWRSFSPPPLPTVQPAFHFLSSLLEQPIIVPVAPAEKVRPPLDPALYGSLERAIHLPFEVLDLIAAFVVDAGSGHHLSQTNHFFHQLTTRHLYRDVVLTSHSSVAHFSQSMESKPELSRNIRRLSLLCHRPQWAYMHSLAKALGSQAEGIEELKVRFQITSPCWLMRPAHLFNQFISEWSRLEKLTLGNFRFDQTLASSIIDNLNLHNVYLQGNGTKHLDAITLSTLLQLNSARSLGTLDQPSSLNLVNFHIDDCPLATRLNLMTHIHENFDDSNLTQTLIWA